MPTQISRNKTKSALISLCMISTFILAKPMSSPESSGSSSAVSVQERDRGGNGFFCFLFRIFSLAVRRLEYQLS